MLRSGFLRSSRPLVGRQFRSFHASKRVLNAQAYKMPAVSPTMEKGNLVEWKYKIGDEINAGDVLLEVESDKAQVEVEAQEDVQLAKILVEDGTKDVRVGQVIAWLADVDDDLSTLKIPDVEEESKEMKKEKPKEEPKKATKKTPEKTHSSKMGQKGSLDSKATKADGIMNAANPAQTLLPSVQSLLGENNISKEEAVEKIKASGKNGRLLKGDVLAYLGKISEDSVIKVAEYVKRGEKLDLANIELRETTPTGKQAKPTKPEPVVIEDQQVVQLPSGVTLEQYQESLRAFVDSAFHRAHGQPLANTRSQYYDEIFESLITPAPMKPRFAVSYYLVPLEGRCPPKQKTDIFDILSGAANSRMTTPAAFDSFVFTFKVQVNDELPDAEAKARRFVRSLKELKIC